MDFQQKPTTTDGLQGDIQGALNSDQRLDANAILQQAWGYTKTSRQPLVKGILSAFFVMFIAILVVMLVGSAVGLDPEGDGFNLVLAAINILIWSPLLAGISLIALRTVTARPHSDGAVFSYFNQPWAIIGTSFLALIVTQLLLAIGVPPALGLLWTMFFYIAFALNIMLVAIAKVSAINGLYYSFLLVKKRFFAFFIIHLVMVILGVLCFLPALLLASLGAAQMLSVVAVGFALYGLIAWLMPTYYHAIGICYRSLLQVQPPEANEPMSSDDDSNSSDNAFNA